LTSFKLKASDLLKHKLTLHRSSVWRSSSKSHISALPRLRRVYY